jgi:hypothetical protein
LPQTHSPFWPVIAGQQQQQQQEEEEEEEEELGVAPLVADQQPVLVQCARARFLQHHPHNMPQACQLTTPLIMCCMVDAMRQWQIAAQQSQKTIAA